MDISREIFDSLKLAHSDKRRALEEINLHDFSIQKLYVYEELPLGNHFHEEKDELFIILSGNGTYFSCEVDRESKLLKSKPIEREVEEGSVIVAPAYVAHTFLLKPNSQVLCFSSKRFDEKNKDIVSIKLV